MTMNNKAMQRKLDQGDCLDVTKIGVEVDNGGGSARVFQLTRFEDDMDYCIPDVERWIWSIGKRKSDGVYFASTDTRYYMNPGYECVWLR
jgi:hypothetical protein